MPSTGIRAPLACCGSPSEAVLFLLDMGGTTRPTRGYARSHQIIFRLSWVLRCF